MLTLTPLFFPRWGDYILGTDFGNTIDPEVGLWDNRSREVLEKLSHRPISNENAGVRMYKLFASYEESVVGATRKVYLNFVGFYEVLH